jgi:hypothetical protein
MTNSSDLLDDEEHLGLRALPEQLTSFSILKLANEIKAEIKSSKQFISTLQISMNGLNEKHKAMALRLTTTKSHGSSSASSSMCDVIYAELNEIANLQQELIVQCDEAEKETTNAIKIKTIRRTMHLRDINGILINAYEKYFELLTLLTETPYCDHNDIIKKFKALEAEIEPARRKKVIYEKMLKKQHKMMLEKHNAYADMIDMSKRSHKTPDIAYHADIIQTNHQALEALVNLIAQAPSDHIIDKCLAMLHTHYMHLDFHHTQIEQAIHHRQDVRDSSTCSLDKMYSVIKGGTSGATQVIAEHNQMPYQEAQDYLTDHEDDIESAIQALHQFADEAEVTRKRFITSIYNLKQEAKSFTDSFLPTARLAMLVTRKSATKAGGIFKPAFDQATLESEELLQSITKMAIFNNTLNVRIGYTTAEEREEAQEEGRALTDQHDLSEDAKGVVKEKKLSQLCHFQEDSKTFTKDEMLRQLDELKNLIATTIASSTSILNKAIETIHETLDEDIDAILGALLTPHLVAESPDNVTTITPCSITGSRLGEQLRILMASSRTIKESEDITAALISLLKIENQWPEILSQYHQQEQELAETQCKKLMAHIACMRRDAKQVADISHNDGKLSQLIRKHQPSVQEETTKTLCSVLEKSRTAIDNIKKDNLFDGKLNVKVSYPAIGSSTFLFYIEGGNIHLTEAEIKAQLKELKGRIDDTQQRHTSALSVALNTIKATSNTSIDILLAELEQEQQQYHPHGWDHIAGIMEVFDLPIEPIDLASLVNHITIRAELIKELTALKASCASQAQTQTLESHCNAILINDAALVKITKTHEKQQTSLDSLNETFPMKTVNIHVRMYPIITKIEQALSQIDTNHSEAKKHEHYTKGTKLISLYKENFYAFGNNAYDDLSKEKIKALEDNCNKRLQSLHQLMPRQEEAEPKPTHESKKRGKKKKSSGPSKSTPATNIDPTDNEPACAAGGGGGAAATYGTPSARPSIFKQPVLQLDVTTARQLTMIMSDIKQLLQQFRSTTCLEDSQPVFYALNGATMSFLETFATSQPNVTKAGIDDSTKEQLIKLRDIAGHNLTYHDQQDILDLANIITKALDASCMPNYQKLLKDLFGIAQTMSTYKDKASKSKEKQSLSAQIDVTQIDNAIEALIEHIETNDHAEPDQAPDSIQGNRVGHYRLRGLIYTVRKMFTIHPKAVNASLTKHGISNPTDFIRIITTARNATRHYHAIKNDYYTAYVFYQGIKDDLKGLCRSVSTTENPQWNGSPGRARPTNSGPKTPVAAAVAAAVEAKDAYQGYAR